VLVRRRIAAPPSADLVELPIHESVPRLNRLKRRRLLDQQAA
jgi:hypothetical protein